MADLSHFTLKSAADRAADLLQRRLDSAPPAAFFITVRMNLAATTLSSRFAHVSVVVVSVVAIISAVIGAPRGS